MSKIAIKGHATRGKEVIEILEMLGGKNVYNLSGDTSYAYYVLEDGEIRTGTYIYGNEPYVFFILEQFLEKYPYKIGDKVDYIKYDDEEFSVYEIIGMMWTGSTIEYTLDSFGLTCLTKDIRLHKEKKINQMSLANCDLDEVEIVFGDKFELKIKDGRYYAIKKKQQYPTTYEECCKILSIPPYYKLKYWTYEHGYNEYTTSYKLCSLQDKLDTFSKLLICRDAYWKIAGEQMGLDKPWEPDYKNPDIDLYVIINIYNQVEKAKYGYGFQQCVLTFPTEEMRDIFCENFKDLIEDCKELL